VCTNRLSNRFCEKIVTVSRIFRNIFHENRVYQRVLKNYGREDSANVDRVR
jgi:hypothetical protein